MIALFVQGALKDGVTTWVPTYLQEVYKTETAFAVIGTTLLPLCNLMGVSLASVVNKITGYHEIGAASFFFGICIMSLSVLYFWNDCGVTASLILLAIATTSMTGVWNWCAFRIFWMEFYVFNLVDRCSDCNGNLFGLDKKMECIS